MESQFSTSFSFDLRALRRVIAASNRGEVDALARLAFYGTAADAAPADEAMAPEEAGDHHA